MYGIPQSGQIAHDPLVQHLAPSGYQTSRKHLTLWTHNRFPINYTLIVNDFGVKYPGKEHTLHLKSVLEDRYKVTTDSEGKLYIVISIQWNYEKGMVQLYMPGYVRAALH